MSSVQKSDVELMTYSIVARDPQTGNLGVAVQTHQMSVGAMVPHGLPGCGVLANQSLVNRRYPSMVFAMLREGISPQRIIRAVTATDPDAQYRQLAIINAAGELAAFTGTGCIPYAGQHIGETYSVQANMMSNDQVIPAMRTAYDAVQGNFANRLLAALEAAESAGGDIRGAQSAAIKIVSGDPQAPEWQVLYDLRVDEHIEPLAELARLIRLRTAQQLDDAGNAALANGDMESALSTWAQARQQAPEWEEIAFWQAVTLAEQQPQAIHLAGQILREALSRAAYPQHWLDLMQRLETCGIIERRGTAAQLIATQQESS